MSGLRVIERINENDGATGFLVAFEYDNADTTYADYKAVAASPSFPGWPHSLWGWFPTRASAVTAIHDAGLEEMA